MDIVKKLLIIGGGAPITAAAAYDTRVLATNPLRYNKLNETSGTAIVDSSGNGYTGTYTGVDLANTDSPFLPDKATFWDGTNDYGNLYSAAFATAFNLDEGCVLLWVKMNALAVWTDGTQRRPITIQRDVNNLVRVLRTAGINNNLAFTRVANGVTTTINVGSLSYTDWFSVLLSWSIAGNSLKVYINGVEVGSGVAGAALGSGLSSTETVLGAASTVPANVHHGWLSRSAIWARPADAAIIALGTP